MSPQMPWWARENSFFGKLKRAVVGIPIFKGHGDLKDHDPKAIGNEQKSKLGVVDRIRKAARGIEAHFALDNDGASAWVQVGSCPAPFGWCNSSATKSSRTAKPPFWHGPSSC